MKTMLVVLCSFVALPLFAEDYIIQRMGNATVVHGPNGYSGMMQEMGGAHVYSDNQDHSGIMNHMGNTDVYTDTSPRRHLDDRKQPTELQEYKPYEPYVYKSRSMDDMPSYLGDED